MARVPVRHKIRGRRLRYLERRLGERYLPREVLERKKQGFASPLMYIMDEEVRTLAPALLLEQRARARRLPRGRPGASRLVDEHLLRHRDHGNRIWLLLSAEVWYRRYIGGRSTEAHLEAELDETPAGRRRAPAERGMSQEADGGDAAPSPGRCHRRELLSSAYDWESQRETLTLGDAVQRFRDVNGYVGLPIPAKPAFPQGVPPPDQRVAPPEEIYRVHDASHVLTGTTFTHDEPPLVLLAGEAVEQGFYFASRGMPRAVGWVLFYGGAFVECARRIAPFGQVFRGIRLGLFNRAYAYAVRTRLTNLFTIPVDELWDRPGGRSAPAAGHAAGRTDGRALRRGPDSGAPGGGAPPRVEGFRQAALRHRP